MRQKEIKVNFPIEWNRDNGRVKVSVIKKVAKHLIDNGLLKDGTEYFITDADGAVTFWSVNRGSAWGSFFAWCVSIEFTEDETAKGCDWFNALYFDKRAGKITESEFESYRV